MKLRTHRILEGYDQTDIKVGVLGSHSALEVAHGAKQEGFNTVAVCQKGREKTYAKYYKNLFDHILLLDKFSNLIEKENQKKLVDLNTIFVPNRSFSVYLGYENIEERFAVPIFGNRYMLKTEERGGGRNQYYLLKKAGIRMPVIFKNYRDIDRLAIVKVPGEGKKNRARIFLCLLPGGI